MTSGPRAGRRVRQRMVGMGVAVALISSVMAVAGLAGVSSAGIVTPTANAVVRDAGPVTITESPGGANGFLCTGAKTQIVVRRANNSVALDTTKTSAGSFSAVWDTSDEDPGFFTITSTVTNRPRSGLQCLTQVVVDQITVEYRPWQHGNFHDIFGYGRVGMNTSPPEFQYTVDGNTSRVIPGTNSNMLFFLSRDGLVTLPENLDGCAADIASCLPADSVQCDPGAGCNPRLAVITHNMPNEHIWGLFDLETGAFVAHANSGGKARVLISAGTAVDTLVSDLLIATAEGGEELTGVDLLSLLSTTVEITGVQGHKVEVLEVGVLRAFQYTRLADGSQPSSTIDIEAPYVVNGGFITHSVAPHTFAEADGDPSVFTVTRSPLVPNVPTLFSVPLGGLGSLELLLPLPVPEPLNEVAGDTLLIGGGPLVNIHGTFPDGTGSHSAGTTPLGPSVDTSPEAPSGLPAWLPGLDGGTIADTGPIDFLGHAALFLDLPQICALGACLDLGSLLIGQGVTIFGDSPLPPLGSLPLLWDTNNPAAAELNELTSNMAAELITNPAVGQVLSAAFTLLGGEVPDLQGVTDALSDLDTFTDLIDTVSGIEGLDAVPGLEDALNELGVVTEVVPMADNGGGSNAQVQSLLSKLLGSLGF